MEINIVAHRDNLIDFINSFLYKNELIFFYDKNYEQEGLVLGNKINKYDFIGKDILVNIGSICDFNLRIKSLCHRPLITDKVDFIYMTNFWVQNETKIVNTSFMWTPNKSLNAKQYGNALIKSVKSNFNYGMQTIDKRYVAYNEMFRKYYWDTEIASCINKLYYNGGVIPICPLYK